MKGRKLRKYTTREFQFEKQVRPSAEARNGLRKKPSWLLQLVYVMHDQYSENETNIRFALCNFRHLNGILKMSLEIFPKKTPQVEKKFKILGKQLLFLKYLLQLSCKQKFIALYRQ